MSKASFEEVMASVRRLTEEAKGQSLEVMEKFYRETSVKYKALIDELDMDVHMEYTHPHHGTLKDVCGI